MYCSVLLLLLFFFITFCFPFFLTQYLLKLSDDTAAKVLSIGPKPSSAHLVPVHQHANMKASSLCACVGVYVHVTGGVRVCVYLCVFTGFLLLIVTLLDSCQN